MNRRAFIKNGSSSTLAVLIGAGAIASSTHKLYAVDTSWTWNGVILQVYPKGATLNPTSPIFPVPNNMPGASTPTGYGPPTTVTEHIWNDGHTTPSGGEMFIQYGVACYYTTPVNVCVIAVNVWIVRRMTVTIVEDGITYTGTAWHRTERVYRCPDGSNIIQHNKYYAASPAQIKSVADGTPYTSSPGSPWTVSLDGDSAQFSQEDGTIPVNPPDFDPATLPPGYSVPTIPANQKAGIPHVRGKVNPNDQDIEPYHPDGSGSNPTSLDAEHTVYCCTGTD